MCNFLGWDKGVVGRPDSYKKLIQGQSGQFLSHLTSHPSLPRQIRSAQETDVRMEGVSETPERSQRQTGGLGSWPRPGRWVDGGGTQSGHRQAAEG